MSAQLGSARPSIPARPQPGDRRFERGAVERLERHAGELAPRRRVERRLARRVGEMDRAARAAESRRPAQERPRGAGQRLDQRPAIAFRPEGGRAAGRMIAGLALGLEDQHRRRAGELGGEARPGHARADDRDVGQRSPRMLVEEGVDPRRARRAGPDRPRAGSRAPASANMCSSARGSRRGDARGSPAALTSRSRVGGEDQDRQVDRGQLGSGVKPRRPSGRRRAASPSSAAPRLKPGSLLPPVELVLIALGASR